MKIDKETPIHFQIEMLAKKHKLTKKQKDDWVILCKTAYMVGCDAGYKIVTTKQVEQ